MNRKCCMIGILSGLLLILPGARAEEPSAQKPKRPELTEEQRGQMEQRLNEAWSKLSVREKTIALRMQKALSQMPDHDRKFIHERIERFMNMSPEQKKQLHENAERWKNMTPEQREHARQQFREKRRQFEEKWKQEHPGEPVPPFPFGRHKQPSPSEPAQPQPDANPQTNNPKGE